MSVFHCVRIWIKNDRTIKMSDLWCHRKLSGCEKNTLRHNGSDRKARAHFPHMFPTASRESRQLPTRVGCKLFDFGLRLILFHQISLSCAKDWSFRPSPHLFLEISQISQIQPPGDGSQQGWQVGDGRGRTVSYSGHLPLPRVPQGPQDVHPRSLQGQPGYARIQGVECCWHVPTCSSHEWIEYD